MEKNAVKQNWLTFRSIFIISLFSFILLACPQQQTRDDAQFGERRGDVENELADLRDEIDDAIQDLNDEIQGTTGDAEQSLVEARDELQRQRNMLEREIGNVREADDDGWDEVERNARQVADQVRARTNEIYRDIEQWVEDW